MTYTPTVQELEELGFEKVKYQLYIQWEKQIGEYIYLYISEKLDSISISICDKSFSIIYPRSLDHLKQIILAFNPTE